MNLDLIIPLQKISQANNSFIIDVLAFYWRLSYLPYARKKRDLEKLSYRVVEFTTTQVSTKLSHDKYIKS